MELQKAIITEFRLKKVTWRSLYIRIKHLQIFVSAWFLVWTSQGLNLGPPDYESVAEHDKSCGFIVCNQLSYKTF